MAESVYLGSTDWLWPGWDGAFYPPDMPAEWRLSFYSSQFNCVWLKASRWRSAPAAEWVTWRDDVHSRFLFLLEDEGDGAVPPELAGMALLMPQSDPRMILFDRLADLAELAREIQAPETAGDLFLVSSDGDLGQLERVRTLLELLGR